MEKQRTKSGSLVFYRTTRSHLLIFFMMVTFLRREMNIRMSVNFFSMSGQVLLPSTSISRWKTYVTISERKLVCILHGPDSTLPGC
jgi:hypothetical protein